MAIGGEAIEAIGPELPGAREELDARGLHLLPGVIDAHVHFNEPGRTDWEGWDTGTRALAAGGATACVEMPLNAHPPTTDAAAFDAKVAAARASAHVDFALWGGLVPGAGLEELAERGVVGFKAFMCDSGIDDFPAVDLDTLGDGMRRAATARPPGRRPRGEPEAPADARRHRLARLRRLAAGRGRARGDRRRARRSPARPAARCTSSTSRAARASSWSPAPAGSTPPARPARTTSRSPRTTSRRSAPAPSARRRCARRASARRSGGTWRPAASRSSPPTTRPARRR